MLKLTPPHTTVPLTKYHKKTYTFDMNKIIFILLFVFAFSASAETTKPTTFKNPIFGLPMHGWGDDTTLLLTPMSIIDTSNKIKYSCELLENNETNILMKCVENDEYTDFKDIISFIRYKSLGIDTALDKYCLFEFSSYKKLPDIDWNRKSTAYFTVLRKNLKNQECGPSEEDPQHKLFKSTK